MKVIAIVCCKGGSGKSTITTNLAVAAHLDGLRCKIIDLDPQGTATTWGSDRDLQPPEVLIGNPPGLEGLLRRCEKDTDLVFLDTPGKLTDKYFAPADLVLIPTRINDADTNALGETLALAQGAGIAHSIVLNQVRPGYKTEALEARWKEELEVEIAGTVCLRKDFETLDDGKGVLERHPKGTAAAEIRILYSWLKESAIDGSQKS